MGRTVRRYGREAWPGPEARQILDRASCIVFPLAYTERERRGERQTRLPSSEEHMQTNAGLGS